PTRVFMSQQAPENGSHREPHQDRRRRLKKRLTETKHRAPEDCLNHYQFLAPVAIKAFVMTHYLMFRRAFFARGTCFRGPFSLRCRQDFLGPLEPARIASEEEF